MEDFSVVSYLAPSKAPEESEGKPEPDSNFLHPLGLNNGDYGNSLPQAMLRQNGTVLRHICTVKSSLKVVNGF